VLLKYRILTWCSYWERTGNCDFHGRWHAW